MSCILDRYCRGRGYQYLVKWVRYDPEHNQWSTFVGLAVICPLYYVWIRSVRGIGPTVEHEAHPSAPFAKQA